MDLLARAAIGALVVVIIQLLSRTRSYYIAGLAPLFPTFALISHYVVGSERTNGDLRRTILFGMFSLIPYLVYLATLYWLVGRLKLVAALVAAVLAWACAAAILIVVWRQFSG